MSQNVALQLSTRKYRVILSTAEGSFPTPGTQTIIGNPRRQSLIVLCAGNWQIYFGGTAFNFGYGVTIGNPLTIFDRYQMGDWLTGGMRIATDAAAITVAETYIDEEPTQWQ